MKVKTLLLGAAAAFVMAPAAMAERGSDGQVNVIYWQAPSIMNPYLSGGTKDVEAASLVIEPLARYDENGALVPFVAAEVPTVANGGVSEDLKQSHGKSAQASSGQMVRQSHQMTPSSRQNTA